MSAEQREQKKAQLLAALKTLLPAEALIHEPEALHPYAVRTACPTYRQMPLLVVLPETLEQLQQVVRLCHPTAGACGGAGGLPPGSPGGALPLADGVLLGLAKFNRILEIDPLARTARVEPGGAEPGDLPGGCPARPLLRPRSLIADRLYHRRQCGGEFPVGSTALKYGLTVHNILELKLVTAEGELIKGDSLTAE